jgi:hypothetical protein
MGISGKIAEVVATPHEYQTVAASQTAQALGEDGGSNGDYIEGVLIVPAVVAAGAVTLLDGSTSIVLYVGGGTTPLQTVTPFYMKLGMRSVNGPWKITTGADVSVIAMGDFT